MKIYLTNSLTYKKEELIPQEEGKISMYVCGPTVYDRPHLGNARSAVVYDVLYRFLTKQFTKVTYTRNITDVDDKIINACKASGEAPNDLTRRITDFYHQDMHDLGCLSPTYEPKATENIDNMITMIEHLIKKGNAYEAEGHVLFSTSSFAEYGCLSRRSRDEMIAGARVEIAPYKNDPADFVLWKPIREDEYSYGFDSPWGRGRPGWHIECSAMSKATLGDTFDIHGGGADLMFPHHENELAQSYAANGHGKFAKYWVHNGFLTVNGEKMSKSLGNFFTVRDVLLQGISGAAIRYFYLTAHYRKPLDYNQKALSDAKLALDKFSAITQSLNNQPIEFPSEITAALADDLNTPLALAKLHEFATRFHKGDIQAGLLLKASCEFLGLDLICDEPNAPPEVIRLAELRLKAKEDKNWAEADKLRDKIKDAGYIIQDVSTGYTVTKARNLFA